MTKFLKKIAAYVGRTLGDLPILLAVIVGYIILSFVTYFVLVNTLEGNQNVGLIVYIVATGGDPTPYLQILIIYPILYWWILIFHVISWLFIPVVVALAADSTYRLFEQRKARSLRLLERKMRGLIQSQYPNLPPDSIENFVEKAMSSFQETIDKEN